MEDDVCGDWWMPWLKLGLRRSGADGEEMRAHEKGYVILT